MRVLIITFIMVVLQSCTVLEEIGSRKKVPGYTANEAIERDLMEPQDIPLPADTSKHIIVYNVVEQEKKKALISDETLRLLIADFFGTVTTILTLRSLSTP